MPINIPKQLPAASYLKKENIFVMDESRAKKQDIRPIKILLLNLMPKKIETETQILRLLSNSPLQVDIDFLKTKSHISKNTPSKHLISFYKNIDEIENNKYDGMIVTGAPVEKIKFEDIDYWYELVKILKWSRSNVFSTLNICWGALASLYIIYNISPIILKDKIFGIFSHYTLVKDNQLLRGFNDINYAPHSRFFTLDSNEIKNSNHLNILTTSDKIGPQIIESKNQRDFFVTCHFEYDKFTLKKEFERDMKKDKNTPMPINYFPNDNPLLDPIFNWKCHANLLFSNWLNYIVYQNTPFDLNELEYNYPI